MNRYAASIFVRKDPDSTGFIRLSHLVRLVTAESESSAIGILYQKVSMEYPASDGWTAPSIVIVEIPNENKI